MSLWEPPRKWCGDQGHVSRQLGVGGGLEGQHHLCSLGGWADCWGEHLDE